MPETTHDHRRAAAERSIEAILDAAERLLAEGSEASISAVAAAAGVSRVTLYSHFPTRPALLEAVAQRVIGRTVDAITASEPTTGDPAAALERIIEAAWEKLDRSLLLVASGRAELSAQTLRRVHEQIDAPLLALIRRGRRSGAFRKDLPASWLLATYYALMHAAVEEVTAGRLARGRALSSLRTTIGAAFRAA